jgi:crotonobetainyl-CoA:carnitine CoA-transferase CaiB-like acyl-CoA transferase
MNGPRVDTPPPAVGQHNDEIFAELGLTKRKVS